MLSKEEVKNYMDSMYETISSLNKNNVEDINSIIRDYKNDYPINPIPYIFWVVQNNNSKYSTFFTPSENVFTFEIQNNVVIVMELKEPNEVSDSNSKRVLSKLQSNNSYILNWDENDIDGEYDSSTIFKKFIVALNHYIVQRRNSTYLMAFLSAMIDKSNWNIYVYDFNLYSNAQLAYLKNCEEVNEAFEGTEMEKIAQLYKMAYYFWWLECYNNNSILPFDQQLKCAIVWFKQLYPNENYTYVRAKIVWKDSLKDEPISVRFELTTEVNEKYDDMIFFYCDGEKEFLEIANDSYTDFYIVAIEEVGNDN